MKTKIGPLLNIYSTKAAPISSPKIDAAIPEPKFRGNMLSWPIDRTTNSFRVYVVEPREYSPNGHADIFNAALVGLVSPRVERLNAYGKQSETPALAPFDLVTFPEAFLPQDHLLSILSNKDFPWLGCVHVGLRPSVNEDQHLFSTLKLRELLSSLLRIPDVVKIDLDPFSNWLEAQSDGKMFNVGCLFTLDINRQFRVCLHPKLVRSKYEFSADPKQHMAEANLLTLVTLLPKDKRYLSITLQPLLCSDVLQLQTDQQNSGPLDAVNTDADCLGIRPPDHIDIISVATCTPQPEPMLGERPCRNWHEEFKDSFKRTAAEPKFARHHFATYVLSNFQQLKDGEKAGLSGAFIPLPLPNPYSPPLHVSVSAWGRTRKSKEDNRWVHGIPEDFSSRGYIASLIPPLASDMADARMMGFVVSSLPRHSTSWKQSSSLTEFRLLTTFRDEQTDKLVFLEQ